MKKSLNEAFNLRVSGKQWYHLTGYIDRHGCLDQVVGIRFTAVSKIFVEDTKHAEVKSPVVRFWGVVLVYWKLGSTLWWLHQHFS